MSAFDDHVVVVVEKSYTETNIIITDNGDVDDDNNGDCLVL